MSVSEWCFIQVYRCSRLWCSVDSSEKDVLTRSINNMADLRAELHHLEKDLSKERLKAKGLEEELQNPLNIHRWRKLEVRSS